MTGPDEHTRELAAASLAAGDPTGWFERLYSEAERGEATVPWDRAAPQAVFVDWARRSIPDGTGRRALVVGCGLGRDAEYLAGFGFAVTAFDISATAVRTARARHPGSPVDYVVADLLDPPAAWRHAFDLVLESITVQALPDPPRAAAIRNVGTLVAPGGTLLVIAVSREPGQDFTPPPWPLLRTELDGFAADGLDLAQLELVPDATTPTLRRWRAEFRRPA